MTSPFEKCLWRVGIALLVGAMSGARPAHAGGVAGFEQNRSRKFGPGECGPADPSYIQLANETGGQPFFLNPSEVGKAFHYVRESSGGRDETLLWAAGTLAADMPQEFPVAIDSTVRRVTFSMSIDRAGADFTIVDATGAVITAADSRAEITALNCGRIVTVDAPSAGMWRLRASGAGRFWMTTHARTELSIVTAEFVRPGGRPGHEGLFRIRGQPVAGAPATLRVVVSRDEIATAAVDLVSVHGDTIRRLQLDTADGDEFVSTFELPSQPFRVGVTGTDKTGNRFQRVFHTLFHAETVEVLAPAAIEEVTAGASLAIPFTIRNVGAAATFRIAGADGRRMIDRVEPSTLTLDEGAAGTVTVSIVVPAGASSGSGTDVTVTATSESGRATTNGATVHVEIKD